MSAKKTKKAAPKKAAAKAKDELDCDLAVKRAAMRR